jgi:peroxidase
MPLSDDKSNLSIFFTVFNRFVLHDLSLAASTSEGYNGDTMLSCDCKSKNTECLIIPQPYGDELNTDQKCSAFPRSAHTFSSFDCSLGKREQLNANTAWLDLSQLYGSNEKVSNDLRQFYYGLLRYTEIENEVGEYLAIFDNLNRFEDGVFKSGDTRVNENLVIQAMYTLFLREHNRIARELFKLNPHWNDERLFQEARKINIAKYSHYVLK